MDSDVAVMADGEKSTELFNVVCAECESQTNKNSFEFQQWSQKFGGSQLQQPQHLIATRVYQPHRVDPWWYLNSESNKPMTC